MVAKVCLLALALFCAASALPEGRDSRITGGSPVSITEFPYVAALVYYYPRPQIYIQRCVGAIVSSWHTLTSSFCFTGAVLSNMHVRAGSTNSMSGGMLVSVEKVIFHPDYVEDPRQNDIAVMFLRTPLPIGSTIGALLLPPQGSFINDYQTFRVVSWGFETEAGPQWQNLRSIFLDNVNIVTCSRMFASVHNVVIDDNVLCAARPGNYGTCFGDSGAPMAIDNVLVGIASEYHECGTDVYPDVFTRVDRFTNWIMEVAKAPSGRAGTPVRVASA